MAEITTSNHENKGSIKQRKKLSTRVDLTPMVDLGFLLITFFIFTTTMAQPNVMKLVLPNDTLKTDSSKAPATLTISLILSAHHTVHYYNGQFAGAVETASLSNNTLREVLTQKMNALALATGDRGKTIVLIKMTPDAMYQDIVNALDEMLINDVKKYMLLDADATEISFIANNNR